VGLALLFPGQGTQHPQMLPWLEQEPAAAPLLGPLQAVLGVDWRSRLADPAWSTSNAVAQPLLVGIELAAWACLAPLLPAPVAVAGYSVGELAAFSAAGVLDAATTFALAQARASAMDLSARTQPLGMAAVHELPLAAILAWCARHGLALAIRLGPDRAVVGGPVDALLTAAQDPVVASGRVTPIGVKIASHTPWMRDAVTAFARTLASIALRPARAPVACNLTGAATRQPAELARCLVQQIAAPVLWDQCLESVAERGVRCVLEVGPGTTLSAMWRAHAPGIPARSVDEFRSPRAVAEWVTQTLARG